MKISHLTHELKNWNIVDLATNKPLESGPIIMADDETGEYIELVGGCGERQPITKMGSFRLVEGS